MALAVAKMAEEKGPKVAHGCQELQLPLVAAVSNGELPSITPEVDELRKVFFPKLKLDGWIRNGS